MEFQQKHIKFLAQQYLNSSQQRKTKRMPSLQKRHMQNYRGHLSRECSMQSFPNISTARPTCSQGTVEGRLQMAVNVDSPGPAAYLLPKVNCRETSAPAYTFGWKTPPKEGGGRRAWQKVWFQSKNPFTRKADFTRETNWPSPFHYGRPLEYKPGTKQSSPSYTFGHKGMFTLSNKALSHVPAPNQYNMAESYKQVVQRSPSVRINPVPHTLYRWASKEATPGPASYDVARGHAAHLPTSPSFFIQGVRRPKKHELGPFSTL